MYVTHESCNCVLNFMLGQPDRVKSSPSKIVMFQHHSYESYDGTWGEWGQADACWDSSLMFIHTDK